MRAGAQLSRADVVCLSTPVSLCLCTDARIGCYMFAGRFEMLQDKAPAANFDTFGNAMIALFQLLLGSNWSDFLCTHPRVKFLTSPHPRVARRSHAHSPSLLSLSHRRVRVRAAVERGLVQHFLRHRERSLILLALHAVC